jgi:predicted lipase
MWAIACVARNDFIKARSQPPWLHETYIERVNDRSHGVVLTCSERLSHNILSHQIVNNTTIREQILSFDLYKYKINSVVKCSSVLAKIDMQYMTEKALERRSRIRTTRRVSARGWPQTKHSFLKYVSVPTGQGD